MEREGKVIAKVTLGTRIELPGRVEHIETEKDAMEKLLQAEMYLNDEIAVDVFRRFGVAIRVHL